MAKKKCFRDSAELLIELNLTHKHIQWLQLILICNLFLKLWITRRQKNLCLLILEVEENNLVRNW